MSATGAAPVTSWSIYRRLLKYAVPYKAQFSIGLVGAVWYFVDPWPLRIAFTILALLVTPLLAVVTFDRRV